MECDAVRGWEQCRLSESVKKFDSLLKEEKKKKTSVYYNRRTCFQRNTNAHLTLWFVNLKESPKHTVSHKTNDDWELDINSMMVTLFEWSRTKTPMEWNLRFETAALKNKTQLLYTPGVRIERCFLVWTPSREISGDSARQADSVSCHERQPKQGLVSRVGSTVPRESPWNDLSLSSKQDRSTKVRTLTTV